MRKTAIAARAQLHLGKVFLRNAQVSTISNFFLLCLTRSDNTPLY